MATGANNLMRDFGTGGTNADCEGILRPRYQYVITIGKGNQQRFLPLIVTCPCFVEYVDSSRPQS